MRSIIFCFIVLFLSTRQMVVAQCSLQPVYQLDSLGMSDSALLLASHIASNCPAIEGAALAIIEQSKLLWNLGKREESLEKLNNLLDTVIDKGYNDDHELVVKIKLETVRKSIDLYDLDRAAKDMDEIGELLNKNDYSDWVKGRFYSDKARLSLFTGHFQECIEYASRAQKHFDHASLRLCHVENGVIFQLMTMAYNVLQRGDSALYCAERLNSYSDLCHKHKLVSRLACNTTLNETLYFFSNDHDRILDAAKENVTLAERLKKDQDNPIPLLTSLKNLSIVYDHIGQDLSALKINRGLIDLACELYDSSNYEVIEAVQNYATVALNCEEEMQEALDVLIEFEGYRKPLTKQNAREHMISQILTGTIYLKLQKYNLAIRHMLYALEIHKKYDLSEDVYYLELIKSITHNYILTKDRKKARIYLEKLTRLIDNIGPCALARQDLINLKALYLQTFGTNEAAKNYLLGQIKSQSISKEGCIPTLIQESKLFSALMECEVAMLKKGELGKKELMRTIDEFEERITPERILYSIEKPSNAFMSHMKSFYTNAAAGILMPTEKAYYVKDSQIWKALNLFEKSRNYILFTLQNQHLIQSSEEGIGAKIDQNYMAKVDRIKSDLDMSKDSTDPYDLIQNYTTLVHQLPKMIDSIKDMDPDYFNKKFADPKVDADLINKIISDDEMVCYYKVFDSSIILLTIEAGEHVALKYYTLNYSTLKSLISSTVFKDISSEQMERIAIELLPDEVRNSTKNLVIIPDQFIQNINFESLITMSKDNYLFYNRNIRYGLSLSLLERQRRIDQVYQEKKGVIGFTPTFTQVEENYISQPFMRKLSRGLRNFHSSATFEDSLATEYRFKNMDNSHSVVHLGTHALVDNNSPLLSKLIFANVESEGFEDNELFTYEIFGQNIDAQLAVVSSCESGKSYESDEGFLALSYAFFYAGCPSVLMTLWKTDEKATAEILEYFYDNLAKGMKKSQALRKAKLQYIENCQYEELKKPYYWAGLVIYGDDSPIHLKKKIPIWMYLIGIGVGVCLFLVIWRNSRGQLRGRLAA